MMMAECCRSRAGRKKRTEIFRYTGILPRTKAKHKTQQVHKWSKEWVNDTRRIWYDHFIYWSFGAHRWLLPDPTHDKHLTAQAETAVQDSINSRAANSHRHHHQPAQASFLCAAYNSNSHGIYHGENKKSTRMELGVSDAGRYDATCCTPCAWYSKPGTVCIFVLDIWFIPLLAKRGTPPRANPNTYSKRYSSSAAAVSGTYHTSTSKKNKTKNSCCAVLVDSYI